MEQTKMKQNSVSYLLLKNMVSLLCSLIKERTFCQLSIGTGSYLVEISCSPLR